MVARGACEVTGMESSIVPVTEHGEQALASARRERGLVEPAESLDGRSHLRQVLGAVRTLLEVSVEAGSVDRIEGPLEIRRDHLDELFTSHLGHAAASVLSNAVSSAARTFVRAR